MNIYNSPLESLYRNIEGSFFKIEREKQNISLNYAAKELFLNKGYLSELENGKKKLSNELIQQMNAFYDVNFICYKNDYLISLSLLKKAFNAGFFLDADKRAETLEQYVNKINITNKISYSFFINHIIIFYHLIITKSSKKEIQEEADFIMNNQRAFSNEELSIFHCIFGSYLKYNSISLTEAEEHYLISQDYSSYSSTVHAMVSFQLISLYAKTQRAPLALEQCQIARQILSEHLNYRRLGEIDILESTILSFLGMHTIAIKKLKSLLEILPENNDEFSNVRSRIYYSLSICCFQQKKYDDSIRFAKLASSNSSYHIDVSKEISYSLYMQNKYDSCLEYIKNQLPLCTNEDQLFLLAIKADIENNCKEFENNLTKYYEYVLNNGNYITLPLVLHIFLNFYTKRNNVVFENKTLRDLNSLGEFRLSYKNSNLLNALKDGLK